MIDIDGGFGEGGGQILRTSVSLAAVLEKDVRIYNIRRGRSRPGMMAQHLTGVKAAAELCQAEMKGAEVGSVDLLFSPGKLKPGHFKFDVGTAGSVTLVLQTLMPIMAFSPGPTVVEITGGTDVRWSPPVDYLRHVALPILNKLGYRYSLKVKRRGHYPRGGGLVEVRVEPVERLRAVTRQERGRIVSIRAVSHAVGLPRRVPEKQLRSAVDGLLGRGLPHVVGEVDCSDESSRLSAGSGLVLYAETEYGAILGADRLGEKGKPAETVGLEAAGVLLEEIESEAFLDRHMGDIIIPYMALAEGASEVTVSKVTQHVLTNAMVAEWVAGLKFVVDGESGQKGRLRSRGLGLSSSAVVSPKESSETAHS